jgi:hypothetical protein
MSSGGGQLFLRHGSQHKATVLAPITAAAHHVHAHIADPSAGSMPQLRPFQRSLPDTSANRQNRPMASTHSATAGGGCESDTSNTGAGG